jgi:hypothetical protein
VKKSVKGTYGVQADSLDKAIGNQIGLLATLNGILGMGKKKNGNSNSTEDKRDSGGSVFIEEDMSFDKATKQRREAEYSKDWIKLAEVFDRIFFLLFLSAIVITTLLLFHPLTKSYFSLLGDEAILGEKKKNPYN